MSRESSDPVPGNIDPTSPESPEQTVANHQRETQGDRSATPAWPDRDVSKVSPQGNYAEVERTEPDDES